jgi:hypothetical protein
MFCSTAEQSVKSTRVVHLKRFLPWPENGGLLFDEADPDWRFHELPDNSEGVTFGVRYSIVILLFFFFFDGSPHAKHVREGKASLRALFHQSEDKG